MELNIIKIAYNPELSNRFQIWIRNTITPSMFSEKENETKQYTLDQILSEMEDVRDLDGREPWIGLDEELLEKCLTEGVSFIEI